MLQKSYPIRHPGIMGASGFENIHYLFRVDNEKLYDYICDNFIKGDESIELHINGSIFKFDFYSTENICLGRTYNKLFNERYDELEVYYYNNNISKTVVVSDNKVTKTRHPLYELAY